MLGLPSVRRRVRGSDAVEPLLVSQFALLKRLFSKSSLSVKIPKMHGNILGLTTKISY